MGLAPFIDISPIATTWMMHACTCEQMHPGNPVYAQVAMGSWEACMHTPVSTCTESQVGLIDKAEGRATVDSPQDYNYSVAPSAA